MPVPASVKSPAYDAHNSALLLRLETVVTEMERLATEARSLLMQLRGQTPTSDQDKPEEPHEVIAERTRRAVMAVQAKARAAARIRRKAG